MTDFDDLPLSDFIDAVYLHVWGNNDPYTLELSFQETIEQLKKLKQKDND